MTYKTAEQLKPGDVIEFADSVETVTSNDPKPEHIGGFKSDRIITMQRNSDGYESRVHYSGGDKLPVED